MAKETVIKCDVCKKRVTLRPDEFDHVHTYWFPVDWQCDPAGGHGEHLSKEFDLCPDCAGKQLRLILQWLCPKDNYRIGKIMVDKLGKGALSDPVRSAF